MTRLPAIFVLVASALVAPLAQAAERCEPRATVDGDPDLAPALTKLLEARGVHAGGSGAGCVEVRATVTRAGDRLALEIRDDAGRIESRDAANVEVAADLVESWARMDLVAPLLEPRPLTIQPIAPRIAPITTRAPATLIGADNPGTHAPALFALDARAELGVSDDGASWFGGRAKASTRFGVLAPLVALRASTSGAADTPVHTAADRIGLELLVGTELPFELGPITLSPGVALGAGWMSTHRSRRDGSACGALGSSVGACVDGSGRYIDDGLRKSTISPRAELMLSASLPLGAGFALALGVSGSISPFAHVDTFLPDYTRDLPAGERDRFGIGGEPLVVGRGMFGISWEAR